VSLEPNMSKNRNWLQSSFLDRSQWVHHFLFCLAFGVTGAQDVKKPGVAKKQFSGPISRSTFFCQAFCVTGAKDVKKPRVAYKQLSGPISISTYFFLKYLVWLKAKMSKKTRVGKKQFSLPISMRTSFFILSSICIHWGPRCQKTGSGQKAVFWTDI